MSFRTRLTSFFVLIVVVPMAAVGFLVFRLIDDSQSGKADARASAAAGTAASVYANASTEASLRRPCRGQRHRPHPAGQARRAASARSPLRSAWRVSPSASATPGGRHRRPRPRSRPGSPWSGRRRSRPARTVVASTLTAGELRPRPRRLGHRRWSCARAPPRWPRRCPPPPGARCRTRAGRSPSATRPTRWSRRPSPASTTPRSRCRSCPTLQATGGSVGADRLLAAVFIAGFLILAFFFSLLASRALHGQLARFLDAARRLGGGDFSSPVPTSGRDEFAAARRGVQQHVPPARAPAGRARAGARAGAPVDPPHRRGVRVRP